MNEMEELERMFKEKNVLGLREFSNRLIDDVFVSQDRKKVEIAVAAYALSKLLGKSHFVKSPEWKKFEAHIIGEIEKDAPPEEIVASIIEDVAHFDKSLSNYITDLIGHVRTKQASRLYALGLSLTQACELCRADKGEVLRYVGVTRIPEREHAQPKNLAGRLKIAKGVW